MGILVALAAGLALGLLARLLLPGFDASGILVTALLGMVGAVVAYLLGRVAGWYTSAPGRELSVLASGVGAILLLVLYRLAVFQE